MAPPARSAMRVASLAAAGILPMAIPPSLTKSSALRLRALPTPTMTRRDASSPAGATRSSSDPFLPLNRSAVAARLTRSPVGPSARRAADPNLTPSSQNRTRTPLAGAARGANSSFKRPDMRLFLSIRRKVEAGFADAIKLAPIARTYLWVRALRGEMGAFLRPPAPPIGVEARGGRPQEASLERPLKHLLCGPRRGRSQGPASVAPV